MSKSRKVLGFIFIVLGAAALCVSLWDKPIDLGFYELDIYQLSFLEGSGALGVVNIGVIIVGILLIIIGCILGIVRSTTEVKEENAVKHNLSAQKDINAKLEERINEEKKRYDKLKKQLAIKQKMDIQKKKALQSNLKKGKALFDTGKYEEAITQWENALSVANKPFVESIRSARAKVEKIKTAFVDGDKRCPYCSGDLMGFEEQCPHCFENLLSPEDMIKRYLQAGLEKYIQEEYSEAISAWTKVLAVDPGHELAAQYLKNAEDKLNAAAAPMEEEPVDPVVEEEASDPMDELISEPEVDAGVPEIAEALEADVDEPPQEISEDDLQGMDIGDLDLSESDDMDSIEDMLSEIGVTEDKMKPEEVGGDPAAIPELETAGDGPGEMYECEVCGAMMANDQLTCPKCGTEYDE